MLLSIGMIVKNEEKTLRKTLDALRELREAVPCELIIADTGSTDATIEIAKEYADVFLEIGWKNDFGWARTQTLKKAKGKWYMQLDADEVLKNASDLITFFNSGEHEKFNRVSIEIRSTFNNNDKEFTTNRVLRLIKIEPGTKYIGKIHEYIDNNRPRVIKYSTTYINHSGYDWSLNPQARAQKMERNISMLKETYRENPTEVMVLLYLIREYTSANNPTEAEESIALAANFFVKKGAKSTAMYAAYVHYTIAYYHTMKDWAKLVDYIQTYLDTVDKKWGNRMDTYRFLAEAYGGLGEYEKAAEAAQLALDAYAEHIKKPYDLEVLEFINYNEINDEEIAKTYRIRNNYYSQAGRFDKLRGQIAPDDIYTAFAKVALANDYLEMLAIYDDIKDEPEDSKFFVAGIKALAKIKNQEARKTFDEKLIERFGINNRYTTYLNLGLKFDQSADVQAELTAFLDSESNLPAYYAKLVLYAMTYNMDVSNVLEKFEQKETEAIIETLYDLDQTQDVLLDYVYQNNFLEGSRDLMLLNIVSSLSYQFMLLQHNVTDELTNSELFSAYVLTRNEYLKQVYRPEVYTVEHAYLLKGEDTFVRLAEDAYNYTGKEYVSRLIKASEKYPTMKFVIMGVLDKYSKDLDAAEKEKEQEMNALSDQFEVIKKSIISLLDTDEDKARELLVSYEAINPSDEDLEYIKERLGVE